uniref:Reverse transcriptase domain-containing protein n=1 Tax=Micrurus carvalhoi TaxID=3147026 RepID=A0A2H6NAP8_9SAUR
MEVMNRNIRKNEEIKGMKIKKEEYKLQAFADDLVFILEEPLETDPKLIGEIEEYGEVAGLKINKEKTKILAKNMTEKQKKRSMDKLNIQIIKKVKYLGIQ